MTIEKFNWTRAAVIAAGAYLSFSVSGCGGGARNVWMRSGVSVAQGEADRAACLELAEAESRPNYMGGAAAQFGDGLQTTIAKYQRRDACLTERGYARTMITPEENGRLKSLRGQERETFWSELLAKYQKAGGAPPAR